MIAKELKNKPLVEAILEVRWGLESPVPNTSIDPHYKILLGRLYDRLQEQYPQHEQLPTALMPDEITGHIVQQRFRVAADDWPLVQLGPGILTLNETAKYTWEDFRNRAVSIIDKLYDAHPKVTDLKVIDLQLRYIDAVDFDVTKKDVFGFLNENLKISINMPKSLFTTTGITELPHQFNFITSFMCSEPKAEIRIRFATATRQDATPILLWETVMHSAGDDIPEMPTGFADWLDKSHTITNDWFFKLIKGDLERRFNCE